MIQASWVELAWVARAIPGSATFSDDIAATTAARARQTTPVTTAGRMLEADSVGGRAVVIIIGAAVYLVGLLGLRALNSEEWSIIRSGFRGR